MMDLRYKVLEYVGWVNVFISTYDFYAMVLRDRDNPVAAPLFIGVGAIALGRYLGNKQKSANLEDRLE